MSYDLNVPVTAYETASTSQSKREKESNHDNQPSRPALIFSSTASVPHSISRPLLAPISVGYNVLAFNQTISKKIDPKTRVNILDSLLSQLKARAGVVFLKRLTIILNEESEKGFGLTSINALAVESYDLLSLVLTTSTTCSLVRLAYSLPSPLTTDVISLPLTSPRLPFLLKHTLVQAAIKNGATGGLAFGVSDSGLNTKRNWWAAAQEVVRTTKGKGIIVSGGALAEADYRGPRDVQNLISLLGLAQNLAHDASTATLKSLII
ncbi:RNase P subunit p30-domain-containing protein [Scleroderma citrinum]